MNRGLFLLLWLLGLALAGLGWSRQAEACVRPAPREWSVDPALAGLDVEPPTPPRGVRASASRFSGLFCDRGGQCTLNTCGSQVELQLDFEPSRDDRSAAGDLGYRLRFREGVLPPELETPLRGVFVGAPPLRVSVLQGFDAVVGLDASFELVAVDGAGHESPGSEPFRLAFNGCTQVTGLGGCAEDRPGVICSYLDGCVEAAADSDSGCSFASSRPAPGGLGGSAWPLGVGLGLAGCALLLRRHRRNSETLLHGACQGARERSKCRA